MGAITELLGDATKAAIEKVTPIRVFDDGTIEVRCDRCGPVNVDENDVAQGWAQGQTFDCPNCGKRVATNSNADYRDRNVPGSR